MIYDKLTTVLMAASSYNLLSLSDLKDDWGITTTADDAFLNRTIARCSAAAAQYCNRVFPQEKVEDSFLIEKDEQPGTFPFGLNTIQLTRWPVKEVNSVTQGITATVLVENTDFVLDKKNGWLIRIDLQGNPKNWEPLSLKVVYTGGFDSIPYDVQDAVSRMVYTRYAERKRDPLVKSVYIDGVERVEYLTGGTDGNLDPGVADLLDNYRKIIAV